MRDHHFRGWCSIDRNFKGNWRNCDLVCTIGGQALTQTEAKVDDIVNQMRENYKKTHLFGGRRLSDVDKPVRADRFVVSFQPGSLNYGLTNDFIRTLIRRQAFRGLEDGHEQELGEAKIVGFRIHSGETPVAGEAEMLPAPTDVERFEFNYTRKKGDPADFQFNSSIADIALAEAVANGSYEMPLLAVGAGIVVLIAALIVIGCCLWKSRSKTDYSEVAAPEDVVME